MCDAAVVKARDPDQLTTLMPKIGDTGRILSFRFHSLNVPHSLPHVILCQCYAARLSNDKKN